MSTSSIVARFAFSITNVGLSMPSAAGQSFNLSVFVCGFYLFVPLVPVGLADK